MTLLPALAVLATNPEIGKKIAPQDDELTMELVCFSTALLLLCDLKLLCMFAL
jgi:hypothetical protein